MQFTRNFFRATAAAFVLSAAMQSMAVAPASAQQAAAPAPAPSASHIAAAREVVALSGISRTYDLFYPQLAENLVNTLSRTRPELRNDLISTVQALQAEFGKRDEQMVESTARDFAAVMSEQALKDTAAFFKSNAGQQYVQMQPRVIDQMMVQLDLWNRQMSEDLMTRVREEMRKKGHNL